MYKSLREAIVILSTVFFSTTIYGQSVLFNENFDTFSNWRPASNNGSGCEWTAENGWAKIKSMGANPNSHIFAVFESDLPQPISPGDDFSFKTYINSQDGDPSGSTSNTSIELVTSNGDRVAMIMWEDSQAASGYGGIIFRNGGGDIYSNDPNGFGRNNPTINNELEIRREGTTWTAYLDGVQVGSPMNYYSNRIAAKVQIWHNKYRNYGYRDGRIDFIHLSAATSSNWQIVDVAPVSSDVDLKVVRDSRGIYHLAWQEGDKIKYTRSVDNCLTWSHPITLRSGVTKWKGIYVDRNDMLHIGYCVDQGFYSYHFSSNDGGNTWSQNHIINSGDYNNYLGGHSGMSVSPNGTIFYGSDKAYDNHFHCKVSTDEGVTWSELRSTSFSLPDTYGGRVTDVTFDSNNDIHVLVWTWHNTGGGNERNWHLKSPDNGLTWTTPVYVSDFDRSNLAHILEDPNNPGTLYIFAGENSKKSTNNGNSWAAWSGIPEGLPFIDRSSENFYLRYIAAGDIYYKVSNDNGVSWSSGVKVTDSPTVESMGLYGLINGFFPYFYGKNDDKMYFIPFWIDTQPSAYYIRCATQIITDVNQPQVTTLPAGYKIEQNYPNPFNPGTTIAFYLPQNANVELTIYDILGQKVKTLTNQEFVAGHVNLVWDGKNERGEQVSSGIFFYFLRAQSRNGTVFTDCKKMTLIR